MSACGGKTGSQFINSVALSVSQQGADSYLNLVTSVNLGNATVAGVSTTLTDPVTLAPIGTFTLSQLAVGQSQIALSVNTNVIPHADANLGQLLPNGNPLPFSLAATAGAVLSFPLLQNSRVYVGGSTAGTLIAGVALTIDGFDQVISNTGVAANVFFLDAVNANLSGIGGIYSSPAAAMSGIAVFGKYVPSAVQMAQEQNDEVAKAKDVADLNHIDNATKQRLMDYFYGDEKEITVY